MPPRSLRPLASAAGPSSLIDYEGCYHYLPIADFIFHGGIYLTGAGHGVISPDTPYPPIRHPKLYHFDWHKGRVLPEFSLILITAGSGVFESKCRAESKSAAVRASFFSLVSGIVIALSGKRDGRKNGYSSTASSPTCCSTNN